MKIGIIGVGFIGGTSAKVLGTIHEVFLYDKYKESYNNPNNLRNTEIVFICVPTPMKPSGEIDCSAIYDSLNTLSSVTQEGLKPLVVIRSTIVPGTIDKLKKQYSFKFVFNPEFLREKKALSDMLKIKRIVIGADNKEDYKKVLAVYYPIFSDVKYIFVNPKTAEMIKYCANAMLAGQISLANEFYQICKAMEIDYDQVKEAILLDERIGKNLDVPGPDMDFGFGGKCFPKDLKALTYQAREHGYSPYLLEEIWRLNERIRKNKDWLNIIGATSKKSYR